jgi:hypothetical protein
LSSGQEFSSEREENESKERRETDIGRRRW